MQISGEKVTGVKPRVGSILFDNSVAKDKLRSSKVLKDLQDQFEKAIDQLKGQGGKEKRGMLMQIRGEFAGEAELTRCRLEILEEMKEKALDNLLLFLLLECNARLMILGRPCGSCNITGLWTTSVSYHQAAMRYLPAESNQSVRQLWSGGVVGSLQVIFSRPEGW